MSGDIDNREAEKRLWDTIEKQHVGMLGVVGGLKPHHFQPMTPFVEAKDRTIWFLTRDDTDLMSQIHEGKAMFVVQANHLQACIGGHLVVDQDRGKIDKFWSPVVAAWYPQGKDDPHLTLLRFDAEDAEVWISDNPLKFAVAITKANLTDTLPDAGHRAHLNLN